MLALTREERCFDPENKGERTNEGAAAAVKGREEEEEEREEGNRDLDFFAAATATEEAMAEG